MSDASNFGEAPWQYYVARKGGRVSEAAAVRPGEYVFCGWSDEVEVLIAASVGAARFEIGGRTGNEWDVLDTYRALFHGVGAQREWELVIVEEWQSSGVSAQMAHDLVVALVASGLDEGAECSLFRWPSRTFERSRVAPDPAAVAVLLDAERVRLVNAEAARIVEEAAGKQAAEKREVLAQAEAIANRKADWLVAVDDSTPFGADDLVVATLAAGESSYLSDWGSAVVTALEALAVEVGQSTRSLSRLLELLRRTSKLKLAPVSPFDGFLEAPREIIDAYQANAEALKHLIRTRDEVLDAVLRDVGQRVMDGFRTGLVWGDLARHGASRHRPPSPPFDELDDC